MRNTGGICASARSAATTSEPRRTDARNVEQFNHSEIMNQTAQVILVAVYRIAAIRMLACCSAACSQVSRHGDAIEQPKGQFVNDLDVRLDDVFKGVSTDHDQCKYSASLAINPWLGSDFDIVVKVIQASARLTDLLEISGNAATEAKPSLPH